MKTTHLKTCVDTEDHFHQTYFILRPFIAVLFYVLHIDVAIILTNIDIFAFFRNKSDDKKRRLKEEQKNEFNLFNSAYGRVLQPCDLHFLISMP